MKCFAVASSLSFILCTTSLTASGLGGETEPAPTTVGAAKTNAGEAPIQRLGGRVATWEVETVRDIAYVDGPTAHPRIHRLDLYLPKGGKGFPVLFFVHGGGWRHGDKNFIADIYGRLGQAFARQGIGAVVINYRLSPEVQHPVHIQDVAKAFAWTHRHIAKYGGRADQIFISGHSAGGHLVALLATDPSYLKAEQLGFEHIKGVMALSGVYLIPKGTLFSSVFTDDAAKRRDASPLHHVTGHHPPFLIVYAEADFPGCEEMSEGLGKALCQCKGDAGTLKIPDRDHNTLIIRCHRDDDPTQVAMLEFIAKHCDPRKSQIPNPKSQTNPKPRSLASCFVWTMGFEIWDLRFGISRRVRWHAANPSG